MNRRSRDLKLQSTSDLSKENNKPQIKAPFLQESNIVDPFGLFNSSVAILYTGIYKKGKDGKEDTS